jgi:hypothetical protein
MSTISCYSSSSWCCLCRLLCCNKRKVTPRQIEVHRVSVSVITPTPPPTTTHNRNRTWQLHKGGLKFDVPESEIKNHWLA